MKISLSAPGEEYLGRPPQGFLEARVERQNLREWAERGVKGGRNGTKTL